MAPTSAKVSRVGMGRPYTPGPVTSRRPCSRVWSVPGQVGSLPWSLIEHEQVVGAEGGAELGEAGVEGGERGRVAVGVAAVTVERVEADQVREDQTVDAARERLDRAGHAVVVVLGVHVARDTSVGVDVGDLADAHDLAAGFDERVENGGDRRLDGEVAAALVEAAPGAGGAGEGARDDARDEVVADEQLARGLAPGVERLERHHVHVGGHLEDAVGARVDDRLAGGDVLGAQLVQDDRARNRPVAQMRSAGGGVEGLHDLVREALEGAEGLLELHAHELPVTRGRVLGGGALAHAAVGALEVVAGRQAGDAGDVAESEGDQVR